MLDYGERFVGYMPLTQPVAHSQKLGFEFVRQVPCNEHGTLHAVAQVAPVNPGLQAQIFSPWKETHVPLTEQGGLHVPGGDCVPGSPELAPLPAIIPSPGENSHNG